MSERVLYPDEEQRRRAYLFRFDPPQFEGGQQKQQAVDAGRDGEGQEVMAEFAGEAEYHNAEELEDQVHCRSPSLKSG